MVRPGDPWLDVRRQVPEILGGLVRRHGDFDACEDAVQDALAEAVERWGRDGWPRNPAAWLTTAASRRLIDRFRSDAARRRREVADAVAGEPAAAGPTGHDDALVLLALCCHPALTPASQVALTLRAVGGLTTGEIARSFLVPEATMAQRISRAKQRVRESGARFTMPEGAERTERLRSVRAVLYLVFNEGYTASGGADLTRPELTREAVRLTRLLHLQSPDDAETSGLLALMLLTEARRGARTGTSGQLIPLAEQDRTRWDTGLIAEGTGLVTRSLARGPVGPYQVQAAIAALHDEARRAEDTDWPQILALYGVLEHLAPNPVVTLNRAVAVAMVHGPAAGLELLDAWGGDVSLELGHRLTSVRGHLLELLGDSAAAVACYQEAARRTTNGPERRYLLGRAGRLTPR